MFITRRELKRTVAATLSVLMLGLSVAMPTMDRGLFGGAGIGFESEHDPSSCPIGHDHTLCTQVGANHAAPAGEASRAPAPQTLAFRSPVPSSVPTRVARHGLTRTRAPPTR